MHEYKLIRTNRKTVTMEITTDLQILVRAPLRTSKRYIDGFVDRYGDWIDRTIAKRRARQESYPEPGVDEIPALREQAREYFTERVQYYGQIMGLTPTGIKITSAKKRFGSCNRRQSICFSWRLMLYPPEARDYIVVHELSHIRHMDHSRAFYDEVEKYMPDWKSRRELLRS